MSIKKNQKTIKDIIFDVDGLLTDGSNMIKLSEFKNILNAL